MRWTREPYWLTDQADELDLDVVCRWLQSTYWAAGRSREVIETSLRHSLNFGLFQQETPVGYARVITDYATHGYLCDVYVEENCRGQGVGRWMMERILEHPGLSHSRIDLFTKDAQEFYQKLGFGQHRFDCLVRYPPDYAGGSTAFTAS